MDGVGALERADAVDAERRVADQLAAELRRRSRRSANSHGTVTCRRPAAFSALITLSVMSTRGPAKTASCRIRSYFSVSKICLMTRLARSTTAASSSFLRWFRSSWNSRRLRWNSRSCSTSSRWRRLRSASASVGASFSSLSAAAFRRLRQVGRAPSRACRTRLRAWPARPSPASPRAARGRC